MRTGAGHMAQDAQTRNISSGGVLFSSEADVPIGGAIEYIVTLTDLHGMHVDLRCLAKWCAWKIPPRNPVPLNTSSQPPWIAINSFVAKRSFRLLFSRDFPVLWQRKGEACCSLRPKYSSLAASSRILERLAQPAGVAGARDPAPTGGREGVIRDIPAAVDPRLRDALERRGIAAALHPPGGGVRPDRRGQEHGDRDAHGQRQDALLQPAGAGSLLRDPTRAPCTCSPPRRWPRISCTSSTALVEEMGADIRAFTYDGDTPQDARKAIRQRANVVLTNPDMLHSGILPHHTQVGEVFREPALRRHRRAALLPRRLWQPSGECAAPAEAHLRILRIDAAVSSAPRPPSPIRASWPRR